MFIFVFLCVCFCLTLEDLPDIDTDSDLDGSEVESEKDSGQQISDCESESPDEKLEEQRHESENVSKLFSLKLPAEHNCRLHLVSRQALKLHVSNLRPKLYMSKTHMIWPKSFL